MSRYLFFTSLLCLGLVACKDDAIDFDYDPGLMHYDGDNANAPVLPVGTNEAAARFSGKVLDFYDGKVIESVQLFIYNVPQQAELIIYSSGTGNTPGSELYSQNITQQIDSSSWNTIDLLNPFQIPSTGDIWIALRTTDATALQVIGCDAGPTKQGGDWLYQGNDGLWRTFRDRSPDAINWNIRAVIF